MWPKVDNEELLPPKYKRPPGRPKKLRMREPKELRPRTRLSKMGVVMVCQKCKQLRHNRRSCRQGPQPSSAATRDDPQSLSQMHDPQVQPESSLHCNREVIDMFLI